jgi:ABC-type glycerol-3-phosphate transport system permease component
MKPPPPVRVMRPAKGATSDRKVLVRPAMALAVLGALPLLLAFVLFQRQIVQGIANTGLKG